MHPDRRRLRPAPVLALVASLGVACAASDDTPDDGVFRPVVGEKALMVSVIDPMADVVWDAVQTIITEEGVEEIQPRTDEEWDHVRNAAVMVAESGNLLMIGQRARDQEDWIAWSLDLVDAGAAAMRAAEARDPQALFDAGGQIYVACSGCHANYVSDPTLLDPSHRQTGP